MHRMDSALSSSYVIDGVLQEMTPARILAAVTENAPECVEDSSAQPLVDESVDAPVRSVDCNSFDIQYCLDAVRKCAQPFPYASAVSATRFLIGSALVGFLWQKGHFRLGNLRLAAEWKWDEDPVGAMAAFYRSVESASDYIDALGIMFSSYSYERSSACMSSLSFFPSLSSIVPGDDPSAIHEPFSAENASLVEGRTCADTFVPDESSWIIYIPFDPSDFRLGGSLLSSALCLSGSDPRIEDADYFIDCFEVVREFSEDSVLLSAATVGRGGLASTLESMCSSGVGVSADLSALMRAYGEKSAVRVLFSEIPGAVIQIRDSDFDYVDAELLLQDVAYFPLGHPDSTDASLRFSLAEKSAIQTILESLLQNAGGESE